MSIGKSFKSSVAASLAAHAALVAALLLAAGSAGEEKSVFFVELKDARLLPSGGGSAEEAEKPPKARPGSIATAEKVIGEKKIPPPPEAVREEKGMGPASAPAQAPSPPAETGGAASGPSGGASLSSAGSITGEGAPGAGFEGLALSSGPELSRSEALALIRKAIEDELTYPPLARLRRIEGTVVAGFSIDGRGAPADIRIVRSSGFSVLDREVVDIIRRAAPYPRLSERVEVPVSFRLVEGR